MLSFFFSEFAYTTGLDVHLVKDTIYRCEATGAPEIILQISNLFVTAFISIRIIPKNVLNKTVYPHDVSPLWYAPI